MYTPSPVLTPGFQEADILRPLAGFDRFLAVTCSSKSSSSSDSPCSDCSVSCAPSPKSDPEPSPLLALEGSALSPESTSAYLPDLLGLPEYWLFVGMLSCLARLLGCVTVVFERTRLCFVADSVPLERRPDLLAILSPTLEMLRRSELTKLVKRVANDPPDINPQPRSRCWNLKWLCSSTFSDVHNCLIIIRLQLSRSNPGCRSRVQALLGAARE